MIGNDIIDLQVAARESNWRRRGYLDKIFTPAEQAQIHAAPDADTMVWLLWSCKEAAYKIVHRATRRREYAPLKFIVYTDGFSGKIIYGDQVFYSNTTITGNCLHTIAITDKELLKEVKMVVLSYTLDNERIVNIEKDILKDADGIPYEQRNMEKEAFPVSLSHHGEFWGMVTK